MASIVSLTLKFITFVAVSASVYSASHLVSDGKLKEAPQVHKMNQVEVGSTDEDVSAVMAAFEDDVFLDEEPKDEFLELEEQNEHSILLSPETINQAEDVQSLQMNQEPNSTDKVVWLEKPFENTNHVVEKSEPSMKVAATSTKKDSVVDQELIPYRVSGFIKLDESIQIDLSRQSLKVYIDSNEGDVLIANVNRQTLEYQASLREGTTGEIVAELLDTDGYIIAYGSVDLENPESEANLLSSEPRIDVHLNALTEGINVRTVSIYHTEDSPAVVAGVDLQMGYHDLGFKTARNGWAREETFSKHSIALMHAFKEGYWSTVTTADLSVQQELTMFTNSYMSALFSIAKVPEDLREKGVIWGRIMAGKGSASGYHVVLKNLNEEAMYFTSYIVNSEQSESGDDGQFVFVGLAAGVYDIEIFDNEEQFVEKKTLVVEEMSVSTVDIEVSKVNMVEFTQFDPLSEAVLNSYLYIDATGETHSTSLNTQQKYVLKRGRDPVLIYSKTEGTDLESVSMARRGIKNQSLAVLNNKLWEYLKNTLNISTQNGVIVGFMSSESAYKVYMEDARQDTQILYFDEEGKPISANGYTEAFGYVIYNLDAGVHTLVYEEISGQLHSEAAFVDLTSVSVVNTELN